MGWGGLVGKDGIVHDADLGIGKWQCPGQPCAQLAWEHVVTWGAATPKDGTSQDTEEALKNGSKHWHHPWVIKQLVKPCMLSGSMRMSS